MEFPSNCLFNNRLMGSLFQRTGQAPILYYHWNRGGECGMAVASWCRATEPACHSHTAKPGMPK